jgi:thymidylate kinase
MIFVVEGCDKSGKTTLIERLNKRFVGISIKITDRPLDKSPVQRAKIVNYYWKILGLIDQEGAFNNFILDRFFPSEMVYSFKRGYDAFKEKEMQWIEDFLRRKNALLILCDPGEEELKKRMHDNPDDYVTHRENMKVLERYNRFFEETTLNKMRLDTKRPVDVLVDQIEEYIKRK